VGEGAGGEGVDVLAEDAREVGDGLALAEADLLAGEEDRAAAELVDRRLEADSGAQRASGRPRTGRASPRA
jgi:hypothetical protein